MRKHPSIKSLAFLLTVTLMIGGMILSRPSYSQNVKGKEIYEKYCAVCHKLTEEKLVGPGLKGITERREKDWMIDFIRGSQEMVKAGDKLAVEVFNEYAQIPMPDHKFLSEDDVSQVLDYIAAYKPEEAKPVSVDITKKDGFKEVEIKRGERLFLGLIPFEKGATVNCASCHATILTDSLNFNPSVLDLAQAWLEPNGTNLYQVMASPTSQKMTEVHKGLQLSDKEIYEISAYFSEVAKRGMETEKTFPYRFLLFLTLGFLMALALADLLFFKKLRFKAIHVLILIGGLSVHVVMAIQEGTNLSRTQGYAPDQPIKFSHEVHAGQNKIDCEYCHSIASYSKSAGIPSANLCMNCHNVVTQGSRSGKFEINKITRAIESGKSIPWVRIHKLPDHAFFSHAQHVTTGKIKCVQCHGKVEEMDLVVQATDLSMGWCVNCHRRTDVDFTGNKYYETFARYQEDYKTGKTKNFNVEQVGGLDCSKCHY